MGRHGSCEETELRDIGSRGNIDALSMVVERGIACSQGWGKAVVHGRVAKLGALSKQDFPNVVESESSLFHGVRDGHSLEISAVMDLSSFTLNKRVISG